MALAAALLTFKREERFAKVEFWWLPPELWALAEVRGSAERLEHLAAVKWYNQEGEGGSGWIYNEK